MKVRHAFLKVRPRCMGMSAFVLVVTLAAQKPELQQIGKPAIQAAGHQLSAAVITFFIERVAENRVPSATLLTEEELSDLIAPGEPGRVFIAGSLVRRALAGVYATYRGWCAHSDYHGQITFPRVSSCPDLLVLVTRGLYPVLTLDTTVHHFIVRPGEPGQAYHLHRHEHTPERPALWSVKKVPLPENRVIPVDALVLIALPEQIYLKEGCFPTSTGPNLFLPVVYAQHPTLGINALYFLNVNRYFSPITFAWRYGKDRFAALIMP
jgi:hypothetical protein